MTRQGHDFTWNYSSGGRQIYADLDNNFKDYNLKEVKNIAEDLSIKKKGEGWSTCCPPNGNKRDIIKQIKRWVRRNSRPRNDWPGHDGPFLSNPEWDGSSENDEIRVPPRSRSPPRRQSRPRSRSPKRGVTFKDDSDCPQSRRPVTLNRRRRNFCKDVGMKKDKYEYYRTQKYYGCCRKKGKKEKKEKKGRIPSKSDMKEMNKTDLQKLAEKVGLKIKGVGWSKCCPPKGNKPHIIKALDKFR